MTGLDGAGPAVGVPGGERDPGAVPRVPDVDGHVPLPRVAAFLGGDGGDDEGRDRVGPGPAESGIEDEVDQEYGREVGAEQGLLRVGDRAGGAEFAARAAEKAREMVRRVVLSRASRAACSRAENCQATAAAEETSTTESRPKPISAAEEAIVPAVMATTASMTL